MRTFLENEDIFFKDLVKELGSELDTYLFIVCLALH